MNLLFRFLWVIFRSFIRPRIGLLDSAELTLHVLPNDLDLNLHLNNGRFLSIMDLGRMDLLGRSGLLMPALRRGWFPIVGSASIRFLRPLNPFQKYRLVTRVLCWDDKWFYLEQRFELEDRTAAIGMIKGLLRGKKGNVPPHLAIEIAGEALVSPPMPPAVAQWMAAEKSQEI